MGVRRKRKIMIQNDQALSRTVNGAIKIKERARRQQRLVAKLQAGKLPYSPTVMSWLSQELDKPARLITPDDVNHYLSAQR